MRVDGCGFVLALLLAGLGFGSPASAQELTDSATDRRLGNAPLVAPLTPGQALASALDSGKPLPLVLVIEGIEGAAPQPVRINLFVNKRDADHLTPTTDANFVGFVQLLPVRGIVRRTSIEFEIPTIPNLHADRSIPITLVPVVGTDNDVPMELSLRIERIYIRQME